MVMPTDVSQVGVALFPSFIRTKNGKRKGKLLPKNEEVSGGKALTNTWKLN